MNKAVLYLMVVILAAALVIAPSATAISNPNKMSNFQISSQKSLLNGFNPNNPNSFQSYISLATVIDYGPPPTPKLKLPVYLGKGVNYQNLFIPNTCPGGCCGCCC